MYKALELRKLSKNLSLKGSGASYNQKGFPETISDKVFEANSSFCVK